MLLYANMKLPKLDYTSIISGAIGLLLLGMLGYLAYFLVNSVVGNNQLENIIQQAGIFGPLVLIVAKASTLVIAPIGGTLLYVIATTLFGFKQALLYTVLGDLLGTVISFWIARWWGRKLVKKFAGQKSLDVIDRLIKKIEDKRWLITARIIGLQDFVNYAAGFMKISFTTYLLIAIVTQIPLNLLMVSIATFPQLGGKAKIVYVIVGMMYLLAMGLFYQKFSGSKNHITKPVSET